METFYKNENLNFYKNGYEYYKVNSEYKIIYKIEGNRMDRIDFRDNISNVETYEKIQPSVFKFVECEYYLTKEFRWNYGNIRYRTTNKDIDWKKITDGKKESDVFHNSKIWHAIQVKDDMFKLTRIVDNKYAKDNNNTEIKFEKFVKERYLRDFEIF